MIYYILIFLIIIIIFTIISKNIHTQIYGGKESKFENHVKEIFESITNKKFPTSYPNWLIFNNKQLELDGYNQDLNIAFETQGPQHTRFDPRYDIEYSTYYNRILNDEAKKILCKINNQILIVIQYDIQKHELKNYIMSRLFDIGYLSSKPDKYLLETTIQPYRNIPLEKELNLNHKLLN